MTHKVRIKMQVSVNGFPSMRRHICHIKPKGGVEEVRWGVRE